MSPQQKKPKLSIVIPTYNEAERIVQSVIDVVAYCKTLGRSFEVIVSDAQSPDGTAQAVTQAVANNDDLSMVKVVDAGERQGKGMNVKTGLQAARGDYHVFMDADLATPLHHLPPLVERLEAGIEVVIAERNLRKIHTGKRLFVSLFGNFLIRVVALPGIQDSQCGFKGFSSAASELLTDKQRIYGWGFDIEYLLITRLHKLHLAVIPADDWYDPKEAEGGMVGDSPLSTAVKTFIELGKIKYNSMRGRYS